MRTLPGGRRTVFSDELVEVSGATPRQITQRHQVVFDSTHSMSTSFTPLRLGTMTYLGDHSVGSEVDFKS